MKIKRQIATAGGPNEMQLMMSLMRSCVGPYNIDMDKATCVRFTTDGNNLSVDEGFKACINSLTRDSKSDNGWIIEGCLIDQLNSTFSGFYDSKKRAGVFTMVLE